MEAVGALEKFKKVKIARVGAFEIFQREGCSKFGTLTCREFVRQRQLI